MKTIQIKPIKGLILLMLFVPLISAAQTSWRLKTGVATGYEWNVLRSPNSYVLDGEFLGPGRTLAKRTPKRCDLQPRCRHQKRKKQI